MFGQTFEFHDLAIIGLLIVLEGVLSIDNALVLGLLAKRLPKEQRSKALTYGLVGAFVFRIIAIATAAWLLEWRIVKLLGGAYLVYIALKHFLIDSRKEHHVEDLEEETPSSDTSQIEARTPLPRAALEPILKAPVYAKFWPTVFVIEMTDIAFAIDSILAAIALVGTPPVDHPKDATHPKLWVVVAGGMLGVILMRFAAVIFIKLLERFPRFDTAAYLLVTLIGLKLVIDWAANTPAHPHRVDFHDFRSPAFWIFWISMLACFAVGFIRPKNHQSTPHARLAEDANAHASENGDNKL